MDENHPSFPASMAIIDSLMNLPLLYRASRESGDQKYHQIAVRLRLAGERE